MIEPMGKIRKGHPSCICAICEKVIDELESSVVVVAYGRQYLAHDDCDHFEGGPEQGDGPDWK